MKVKQFIELLSEFDPDMEVIISDGFEVHFHHTNNISIEEFEGKVDIGIGRCNEQED